MAIIGENWVIEENAQPSETSPDATRQIDAEFWERVKYIATLESTYRTEKSKLESVISAYQTENLRLESAIMELQKEFKDRAVPLRGPTITYRK